MYQTNIASSYAAGRWAQLHDPESLAVRPFWRYIHRDCVLHPRPEHKDWGDAGFDVAPRLHPFWRTHFPPNGWGCHCTRRRCEDPSPATAPSHPMAWDAGGCQDRAPPGIDKGGAYAPGRRPGLPTQSLADAKQEKLSPEGAGACAGVGKRRLLGHTETYRQ
ncbi:MAG: hypothetical protein IPN53_22955 [Comamonadaceae bacterium]|nr:hypothetical protein [Comamonadaceae bacterium]